MLTRLAFGSTCLSTPLLDRCRTLHAQREAALEAGSVAGSTSISKCQHRAGCRIRLPREQSHGIESYQEGAGLPAR